MKAPGFVMWSLGAAFALAGCASRSPAESRSARARYEYNRIGRELVTPAAEATNDLQRALLWRRAERAYEALREDYPDARPWAAAALRSQGRLYREQGAFADALAAFTKVGALYPEQEWEVAQAWKAAGDLLWERGLKLEAEPYYRGILARFDTPGRHPMYETLVLIARSRLAELPP